MNKDQKYIAEAYNDVASKNPYELVDRLKEKYSQEQYPFEAILGALRGYVGVRGTEGSLKEFLELASK